MVMNMLDFFFAINFKYCYSALFFCCSFHEKKKKGGGITFGATLVACPEDL